MTIHMIIGEKIANTRLTYMSEATRVDPKQRRAHFMCDCGEEITTNLHWVRFLTVTSCGCYKRELVVEKNTKHGHAVRGKQSGAYRSWHAMHQRVLVNPRYANVTICARWCGDDGFANFIVDMGDRPDAHSIERMDNHGNYEPGNCKWATKLEQAQNTDQTCHVTINGESHSINEWCRIKGIGYHVIKQRRRRGMSIEDAITIPLDSSKQGRKK